MKIKNLIKALEKKGIVVTQKTRRNTKVYTCINRKNICTWYEQDHDNGEIDSVCIENINDRRNISSDYFPGTWCQSIKSIVNLMVN